MGIKHFIEETDTPSGRLFDLFIQVLIVLSLISFSIDTLPDLSQSARRILRAVEAGTVAIFTVPQIAIDAIRALGATPSFGSQNKLRDHLAQGSMQVYETDRATWRRELLYASDGSQILLVRETP